ncbi:MAG: hypothetical protein HIU86_08510 [Acidobacteria bacterium]|nr:hypothetical protein [Acidobacteriota bacterium]
MDGRGRRQVTERFDLGIGFLGFFAVAFFLITLFAEIRGDQAVGWAVITLVLAAMVVSLLRGKRKALRRMDQSDAAAANAGHEWTRDRTRR